MVFDLVHNHHRNRTFMMHAVMKEGGREGERGGERERERDSVNKERKGKEKGMKKTKQINNTQKKS